VIAAPVAAFSIVHGLLQPVFVQRPLRPTAPFGVGPCLTPTRSRHRPVPASQGLVSLLEPSIDTVCTMTALTIAIADPASWAEARAGEDIGGVTITSDASEAVLPRFPGPADRRGAAVRLLHNADLGLLRPQSVVVPLRQEPDERDHLQGRLEPVRRSRDFVRSRVAQTAVGGGDPEDEREPTKVPCTVLGTRQPHLVERGYFQDSGAWANGLSDVAINNIDYLELDSWSIELIPTCDLAGRLRSCSSPPKPLPPPC
jgi:hypothetical protein